MARFSGAVHGGYGVGMEEIISKLVLVHEVGDERSIDFLAVAIHVVAVQVKAFVNRIVPDESDLAAVERCCEVGDAAYSNMTPFLFI